MDTRARGVSASPTLSRRLQKAVDLAIELHGRDARKGGPVPVLAHLFGVCALVQYDGGDENEAIAALLHDGLEDHPGEITGAAIERRFGRRVRRIVEIATDTGPSYRGGTKAPWRAREEAYIARCREEDPAFLRVTVADKVDNLRAMIAEYRRLGDRFWSRFRAGKDDQLWYYGAVAGAYEEAGFSGPLLEELRFLIRQLQVLS